MLRHNLHPVAERVRLPGRRHGLVFQIRAFLGDIEHAGYPLLYGIIGKSALEGETRDLQHGPGVQFTSPSFTSRLLDEQVLVSMDGRGRAFDNIFIERLWRSVKYEEVYLKDYETVMDAVTGIGGYLNLYSRDRLHQSLDYRTPAEVYFR